MTAMMLALMFSDATLNASKAGEYRLVEHHDHEDAPQRRVREWSRKLDRWTIKKEDCPAFFQRELEGLGMFRVGLSCVDEEIPYAL